MNRGAGRQSVFYDNRCCYAFLECIGESIERYGVRVHGYALMPNHYHLLVESVRGNLSNAMQHLVSRYAQIVNELASRDGTLFRGRFHNKIVHEEAHWRYLLAYLHLNPVRARLVMKLDQAEWTSHGRYSGQDRYPEWLTTASLKKSLRSVGGYKRYLHDVMSGRRPEPPDFATVTFGGRRAGRSMMIKQPETRPDLSAYEALRQVAALTGINKNELRKTKRGRSGNPARALAAWWLVFGAGLTNVEAGEQLGMTPEAVSKVISKTRNDESYHGGILRDWMTALTSD
jgi:REP element-mobilizing transposase RayT